MFPNVEKSKADPLENKKANNEIKITPKNMKKKATFVLKLFILK